MIIGQLHIDEVHGAVNTHRDSYLLNSITVVSVRRPFLLGSLLVSTGLLGFTMGFADLLYTNEIALTLCSVTAVSLFGWQIGRLKLLSRDLRGSELSDVIWGRHASLNVVRIRIASAMNRHKGGQKP